MIDIIDINGEERIALSLKRIFHPVPVNDDGEMTDVAYVEAVILGQTGREWTEWYPLRKFEELNPGVKIDLR
jgi:hypothetical protein